MDVAGIGVVLVLLGLSGLLMAFVQVFFDQLPPRSDRLAEIARKKIAGEELTENERLEASQSEFEKRVPVFGAVCLLLGLLLVVAPGK